MDQEGFKKLALRYKLLAGALLIFAVLAIAFLYKWKRSASLPPGVRQTEVGSVVESVNPLQLATRKVEEDRGEPTGNNAEIKIPAELKLYQDRRRFLAIQIAEWREQKYDIPRDFFDLASMMKRGEFDPLPTLAPDYLLYGVGLKADAELTHYDEKSGKSVPLLGSDAELQAELERLNASLSEFDSRAKELKGVASRLKRDEQSARREAAAEIARIQKSASEARNRIELLQSAYKGEEQKRRLFDEYQNLAELAKDFDGQTYDLRDADARRKFKVRLLSALRPPARLQLEAIARSYNEKFNRPLPVTSLVRTIEYQRHLGEAGNPNAIQIDIPPHTTGLAFDIYTFYMTAAEQQFLNDEVARLEKEGRVEALRENRFHIHVFAFADTRPPSEQLIKESLSMKATAAAPDDQQ